MNHQNILMSPQFLILKYVIVSIRGKDFVEMIINMLFILFDPSLHPCLSAVNFLLISSCDTNNVYIGEGVYI